MWGQQTNFYKYGAAWRNATGLSLPLPKQAFGFAQAGVPSPRTATQGQRFAEFIPIFLSEGFPHPCLPELQHRQESLAGVLQECSYSTI